MNAYEIEIKSLLGEPERAEELRRKLKIIDPNTKLLSQHKQLNHYFEGGNVAKLYDHISTHLSEEDRVKLRDIIKKGSDFSVRTRLADTKLLFVIKASLDEGSSHNTISRLEFEGEIIDMTLDELDQLIQDAGFSYQAKWSREREEYACNNIIVCLDKNAGYGYLAEFEKVVDDEGAVDEARNDLRAFMQDIGFDELPQDRLERMFTHYNAHWPEYYGTDKIFTIH
jgi:predicted adenylyl cyclase CyaB